MKQAGAWESAEAFGLLASALAVAAACVLHLRSPVGRVLASGGALEGAWMVSDALAAPNRTESVWARWEPSAGTLRLVSVPPAARLVKGDRKRLAGREYKAAVASGQAPSEASARTAAAVGTLLGSAAPLPWFLHVGEGAVDKLAAALGASTAAGADDAALGIDPALRRAVALARAVRTAPWGPWQALRTLMEARGETTLSRYDLIVLALEAAASGAGSVRPAELPLDKRGDLLAGADALWRSGAAAGLPTAEVLNAGGPGGAAEGWTRALRQKDVDVVYFGNHRAVLARTWVLDRTGGWEAARKVADRVPGPEPEVWTVLAPDRMLEASVLIGADAPKGP